MENRFSMNALKYSCLFNLWSQNREIISLLMFFLPPLLLFAKRFPATYIPFNRKRYTLLSIIAIVRKELVYAYGLVNSDFFWLTYSPLTRSFSHPRTPLIYSLNMWGCFNQTVLNVWKIHPKGWTGHENTFLLSLDTASLRNIVSPISFIWQGARRYTAVRHKLRSRTRVEKSGERRRLFRMINQQGFALSYVWGANTSCCE